MKVDRPGTAHSNRTCVRDLNRAPSADTSSSISYETRADQAGAFGRLFARQGPHDVILPKRHPARDANV